MKMLDMNAEAKKRIRRRFARRMAARLFDFALYYLCGLAVYDLILRMPAEPFWRGNIFVYVFPLLLAAVLEPLQLAVFGTTAGKALLGLRLKAGDGRRLTAGQAFQRYLLVFRDGLGFGIPVYNVVCVVSSRRRIAEEQTLSFDEGVTFEYSERRWLHAAAAVLGVAVLAAGWLWIAAEKQLPRHRGAITAAQYVANINDLIARLSPQYGAVLGEDGIWIEDEGVVGQQGWLALPAHRLTEKDGVLVEVRFDAATDADFRLNGYLDQKALAYVAFVGARPGYTGLELQSDPILPALRDILANFSKESHGVVVGQEIVSDGYALTGSYLDPIEGAALRRYDLTFTMEKVD